jgi:epoxyqueuosine reductase QueG
MNEEVFTRVFGKSPLMRAGYAKWHENQAAARHAAPQDGRAKDHPQDDRNT